MTRSTPVIVFCLLASCGGLDTGGIGTSADPDGGRGGRPIPDASATGAGGRMATEASATATGGAGQPATGGVGPESSVVCQVTTCDGTPTGCGDCIDNDADGRTDMDDEGCVAVCDDSEDSIVMEGPSQMDASPCFADCLFDGNTGAGDDGCRWDVGCGGNEQCLARQPSCGLPMPARCSDTCLQLTPNGCDCFGCCELAPGKFVSTHPFIGSSCRTVEDVSDPSRCPPCTPVADCFNPCDDCELCITRRIRQASCKDPAQCTTSPCGLWQCPGQARCIQGCCVP